MMSLKMNVRLWILRLRHSRLWSPFKFTAILIYILLMMLLILHILKKGPSLNYEEKLFDSNSIGKLEELEHIHKLRILFQNKSAPNFMLFQHNHYIPMLFNNIKLFFKLLENSGGTRHGNLMQ